MLQNKLIIFKILPLVVIITPIIGHVHIRAEPPVYTQNFIMNISMPDVKPSTADSYICTAKRLSSGNSYITGFEPYADVQRAHHMLLFGCEELDNHNHLYPHHWNCIHSQLCKGMTIMYAWAKNAPPVTLPPDVGFRINGNSSIRYVILQLHYAKPLPENESDRSGLMLRITRVQQKYIAGIHLLLASNAVIPPRRPKFHVDVNCYVKSSVPIHPFAYRVHAHQLGVVISGYQYNFKNGSWTFLAKGNPQWPQAFFPMDHIHTVATGDLLALRCTFNSSLRMVPTYMGSSSNDEMCNLYIMYYTRADGGHSFDRCIDVEVPHLVGLLPSGNDVPFARNPAMEEHAQGYPHDNEQYSSIYRKEWNQKSSVHKKGNTFQHDGSQYYRPLPPQSIAETFIPQEYEQQMDLNSANPYFKYKEVENWPNEITKYGQVAAVDIDAQNNVVIFHRGNHVWNEQTFDAENRYQLTENGPISSSTVVTLDPVTGHLLTQWGSNLFYMPHGLTVQKDYVWLTDVALHQVFKFPLSGAILSVLTLGERFTPGNDHKHFCKPTSVAISSTGNIYVADGYCNSRIVRFSSEGDFMNQWGQSNPFGVNFPPKGAFAIPHKIILAEDKQMVCVADRENGRIQCFTLVTGNFQFQIARKEFGGRLFSIDYIPFRGGLLYAVCGPSEYFDHPVQAFVFNFTNQQLLNSLAPKHGSFSQPHDIAVTLDGNEVFVSEIGPNKVWKFLRDSHKSTKKVLEDVPPMQMHPVTVPQSTDSVNVVTGKTTIVENQDKLSLSQKKMPNDDISSFGTSMIIMALLAIPVLLLIIITAIIRLKKRGKLQHCSLGHLKGWLGGYRTPHPQDKFNIGNLLNPHKGFDRVAMDESDIDGEGSGSDIEEFSAVARKA